MPNAAGWLSSLVEPWPIAAAAELPGRDSREGWHRHRRRRCDGCEKPAPDFPSARDVIMWAFMKARGSVLCCVW
jgi:hypothetical protein